MQSRYSPEATFILALAALVITFCLYVTWQSGGIVLALVLAYFIDKAWYALAPHIGKDLIDNH
ncbi:MULTISPECIES: hypothetical protein [Pseudovibrio]|uniref:hypothetical protein n=1 Tax=Stappiaceae TaxID=2821832 RepID=UPI0023658C46|nr:MULTISPECIES: hypothetical protein [Pseudovibrio]MDD7908938.1 hypothetical protein [Pseudovibrio exalbescens]MDX5593741.1 hypothetical protein [Pseudovibrio sp. SPO723]